MNLIPALAHHIRIGLFILAGITGINHSLTAQVLPKPGPKALANIILREAYLAQIAGDDKRAIELYEEYLKQGEPSAHLLYQYAHLLASNGNQEKAVKEISRALELTPDNPVIIVGYANIMQSVGRRDEAQRVLQSATHRFPNNAELEFNIAEIYFESDRLKEARIHYKQVLFKAEQAGSNGVTLRNVSLWRLANIYLKMGDFNNSLVYFVRFVKNNPDNIYSRYILGYHLYFKRGQYDRARRELEAIVESPLESIQAQKVPLNLVYSALGKIYYLQNDYRATRYIYKAYALGGSDELLQALYLEKKGEPEKATISLVKFLTENSVDFIARIALLRTLDPEQESPNDLASEMFQLSLLADDIGQHRLGIDLTRQAQQIKANTPEVKISESMLNQQLAQHYEALDQEHRTIYYLRRSLEDGEREKRFENNSLRKDLQLALARHLAADKVARYDAARTLCNKLLEQQPDDDRIYYVRAMVNYRAGKYRVAIEDFSRAIELNPEQILYYFFRAVTAYEIEDFESTESDLKKVLSVNPNFPEANNFLGYIYAERSTNLKEARRLIEKAIDDAPTNGAYQDSLGWLYYQEEEWDKALYHIKLAALLLEEAELDDPVVFDHLGDVYLKLKEYKMALASYNRSRQLLEKMAALYEQSQNLKDFNSESQQLLLKVREKINRLEEPTAK